MNPDEVLQQYDGLLRFLTREYFAPGLTADDLLQEARIGAWKACRDFRPDGGSNFRNFLTLCVRRQLVTAVKTATRGKHASLNESMSLDAPPSSAAYEDMTLADVIAAPDPERPDIRSLPWDRLTRIEHESIVRCILDGELYEDVARDLGVTVKSVDNAVQRARRKLAAPEPREDREHGVLLVDRELHPTELDAVREARRVRPGCHVVSAEMRKWRRGRVTSTRGRATADGYLGRPVWAVEIAA